MIGLMVMSRAAARGGVFEPEQLEILQRVFDQACIDRGYPRTGLDAEELASMILRLFHRGIMSEASLTVALDKESRKTPPPTGHPGPA
ncbi:hypothetical protein SAMN04488498_1298 [Mesorhizobium albiziae]|uniref:Uncharacterized protein n=1 Tax=Neomesorhizobium albiziae TaxID=335020 RepID=A0A1I4EP05_9HYPH|nr:hypothetical protein [Mesorhizobium albiziae]GLS30737.1 hypothetical protein GCM10007937_24450 [Mesorhizobium albiziae]SFL07472.1 hypothetical protein SAMN04488498_1298 [Mesorhizobium albiziae]